MLFNQEKQIDLKNRMEHIKKKVLQVSQKNPFNKTNVPASPINFGKKYGYLKP